jgi:uncharacterized integral membrane protein
MIPKTSKPPGKQIVKQMTARTKWLILAPLGLILIGAGLCIFNEAGEQMHHNEPFIRWFLMGTYSLILVNGGLVMFGQAIVFKVQMTYRQEMRREIKRLQKDVEAKLKKKMDKRIGKEDKE